MDDKSTEKPLTIKPEIQALCNLMSELNEVVEADQMTWRTKCEIVFDAHKTRLTPRLNALGLHIAWDDPDMDYKDDVQAFHQGMMELYWELRAFVEK